MEDNERVLKSLPQCFVVDDTELSRKSIVELLESNGYNVLGSAGSAQECIDNVSSKTNTLIIDVVMPDLSGIELVKVLTKNMKKIYVIMISSLKQENIIIESISAGAKDFIQKPFNPEDLLSAVERAAEELLKEKTIGGNYDFSDD